MAVNVVLKSVWNDKGLKEAQSSFSKFGKNLTKVGATLAAVATGAAVAALVSAGKAAAEDAKSQALLAQQLRNTVDANDAMIASVEESIKQMQLSAAVADDVLRPAFAQLVRATGDVDQATRLMQIALDVSAGTGRDVNAVAIALSRAYQGNTTALSRLGIKAKDGVDVFAMLEEQFAGAAETAARNDPFQRLTIIFGELQEQLGQFLLPYLNNLADFFASQDFQVGFAELIEAIAITIEEFDRFFKQVSGTNALNFLQTRLTLIAGVLSTIAFAAGEVGETIQLLLQGKWQEAGRNVATFGNQLDTFTRNFNRRLDDARKRAQQSLVRTPTTLTGGGGFNFTKPDANVPKKETAAQKAAREQREGIEKAREIIAETAKELEALQAENTKELAKINADYLDKVAETNRDFAKRLADIVQQSQDRLRDAYRNAVAINISEIFGARTTQKITTEIKKIVGNIQTTITRETEETVGGSVDDLVTGLRNKLESSRQLLANSAALASAGFSQTFIEQVVGAGTDTGNELAKAILEATPETQNELRNLFIAVETQAETGMDALAKSIYEKAGLATRELKALYATTQSEQVEALLELKNELDKSLQETNEAFKAAVIELKDKLKAELAEIKTDISAVTAELQALLDKMSELSGVKIGIPDVVMPATPTPTKPTTGGTTINVIAKTDPTKSAAETGRQVAKVINKYTGRGGGLKIGQAAV